MASKQPIKILTVSLEPTTILSEAEIPADAEMEVVMREVEAWKEIYVCINYMHQSPHRL